MPNYIIHGVLHIKKGVKATGSKKLKNNKKKKKLPMKDGFRSGARLTFAGQQSDVTKSSGQVPSLLIVQSGLTVLHKTQSMLITTNSERSITSQYLHLNSLIYNRQKHLLLLDVSKSKQKYV